MHGEYVSSWTLILRNTLCPLVQATGESGAKQTTFTNFSWRMRKRRKKIPKAHLGWRTTFCSGFPFSPGPSPAVRDSSALVPRWIARLIACVRITLVQFTHPPHTVHPQYARTGSRESANSERSVTPRRRAYVTSRGELIRGKSRPASSRSAERWAFEGSPRHNGKQPLFPVYNYYIRVHIRNIENEQGNEPSLHNSGNCGLLLFSCLFFYNFFEEFMVH